MHAKIARRLVWFIQSIDGEALSGIKKDKQFKVGRD